MLTIPLCEPTAIQRSGPRGALLVLLLLLRVPPSVTTVIPTAPSSIHLATTFCSRKLHSTASPALPNTVMPSPFPHQSKSATPPFPSTRTCATHWHVLASKTFTTPPPLRALPTRPIQRPHLESLNRSILRCSSSWP